MTTTGLEPHQQRVVAEKAELDERLGKLLAFIDSLKFAALPPDERARLQKQFVFMESYAAVLGERIAAFKSATPAAERYGRDDVDLATLKWATLPRHEDPFGEKVSYFVRMRDGKEVRGFIQMKDDGSPWPPSRIAAMCALHALRVANGEAS